MIWGVFKTVEGIHTAPCLSDGQLLVGHDLQPRCECRPTPQRQSDWAHTLWRHHDNH